MSARLRAHLRSNLVAYIALFFALGGGAYAASTAAKNSVATKSIRNGAVTSSKIANGAVKNAKLGAGSVSTSKFNTSAVAPDSAKLGGSPPSAFQTAITGSCSGDQVMQAISAAGAITCTDTVKAISATPQAVDAKFVSLGHGLQLALVCHDGGTKVAFQNLGSGATLNWFFSDGTTVSASGATVPQGVASEQDFDFPNKRLEGQFIWSGDGIWTVNLHAYDGTSFCEFRGTAVHVTP
ncbi:MAG: hypothetical protein QOI19_2400 [Thermoleophilaceae bacterium]|jgi:hypothetical protein|nr:hypothetical protein [Thermoleophilaceae bacterium]